jgi:5-methylcytosine-specific restriction protein A
MKTVDDLGDIASNVLTFNSYRASEVVAEREFYADRIRLGKNFVAVSTKKGMLFCPSRFAGYKWNTMEKHLAFEYKSGSVTTPRITSVLGISHENRVKMEDEYLNLCAELQIEPSAKQRSYWVVQLNDQTKAEPRLKTGASSGFPDDVYPGARYPEGAVKKVTVNAYERNPKARKACIEHYGTACIVCGIDFQVTYGTIGQGFIHVHHLYPIALRDEEYEVDPINDMQPVCPNCHAMLHRSDPPFTIDDLRDLVAAVK